jgi:hypothetical protein
MPFAYDAKGRSPRPFRLRWLGGHVREGRRPVALRRRLSTGLPLSGRAIRLYRDSYRPGREILMGEPPESYRVRAERAAAEIAGFPSSSR